MPCSKLLLKYYRTKVALFRRGWRRGSLQALLVPLRGRSTLEVQYRMEVRRYMTTTICGGTSGCAFNFLYKLPTISLEWCAFVKLPRYVWTCGPISVLAIAKTYLLDYLSLRKSYSTADVILIDPFGSNHSIGIQFALWLIWLHFLL